MFLDELSPIFKEMTEHPVAFLGGFFSGVFQLNLSDDPVKSWLEQQGASPTGSSTGNNNGSGNYNNRPQSISID